VLSDDAPLVVGAMQHRSLWGVGHRLRGWRSGSGPGYAHGCLCAPRGDRPPADRGRAGARGRLAWGDLVASARRAGRPFAATDRRGRGATRSRQSGIHGSPCASFGPRYARLIVPVPFMNRSRPAPRPVAR
jgi:hypothetical protein